MSSEWLYRFVDMEHRRSSKNRENGRCHSILGYLNNRNTKEKGYRKTQVNEEMPHNLSYAFSPIPERPILAESSGQRKSRGQKPPHFSVILLYLLSAGAMERSEMG